MPVVANDNALLNRPNNKRDDIYLNMHWIPCDALLKHPNNDPIWVDPGVFDKGS